MENNPVQPTQPVEPTLGAQPVPTTPPDQSDQSSQPPQTPPPAVPPTPAPNEPAQKEGTGIALTILTILLLLFFYPLGLLVMWFATKWPRWVKILLTAIPVLLIVIGIGAIMFSLSLISSRTSNLRNQTPYVNTRLTPTLPPSPVSTASADTLNWKTYSDNIYSIKYPSSLNVKSLPPLAKNLNCIYLEKSASETMTVCSSTDNFPSVYPEYINNPNHPLLQINGYDAYKDTSATGQGGYYLVDSNGQFVNIAPVTLSDNSLFSQILSTVRFAK